MKTLLLILLLNLTLQADHFTLTMNDKNLKMCRDMGRVFNKLTKTKTLKDFKEFNSIKWDKKYTLTKTLIKPYTAEAPIDVFDINNDGKEEIVSLLKWYKGNDYLNMLLYYNIDLKNKVSGTDVLSQDEINKYNLGGLATHYTLEKYPFYKVLNGISGNSKIKVYPSIRNPYIRVFRYQDKYYVAQFDNIRRPLNKARHIIISQFNPNNTVEDFCYYINSWQED